MPDSINNVAASLQQQVAERQQQMLGQGAAPGAAAGGASGLPATLPPLPPMRRPSNHPAAADLLAAVPVEVDDEILDDEMLHWILSLGSGAAPGGSLPHRP